MNNPKTTGESQGIFTLKDGKNVGFTFALVSSLFLLWGVCNGMIDVMDRHFQKTLHIALEDSAKVQTAHYLGYCLMALFAGYLAKKLGYKGGIIAGLIIVSIGGFWFIEAKAIGTLFAYLGGVFVLATGLSFLETVANPYTTVLGARKFSATRINLAQSCNGVGWIFGPIIGSVFFYGATNETAASERLWIPYAVIAVFVLVLAVVFYFAYMPNIQPEDDFNKEEQAEGVQAEEMGWGQTVIALCKRPHFLGGVLAQFCYVGAQCGIFALFINYIIKEMPSVGSSFASLSILKDCTDTFPTLHNKFIIAPGDYFINDKGAAVLDSAAFILFLLGRLVGASLMGIMKPFKVLGFFSVANVLMMGVVFAHLGWISVAAVFVSYFFMSIMFPTIFSLGISGLGELQKVGSSFLVMAIAGGACVPLVMARVCSLDMPTGFIIPLACFVVIAFYAYSWPSLHAFNADDEAKAVEV
jgi:FHS family L-fucose permease-like MFS transporter